MCRLALMNRQAVLFLGSYLEFVFGHLEHVLGGDGNGIAGVFSTSGVMKSRKGVTFSSPHAALYAQKYANSGADWILFHTRRATSARVHDSHCHPFRSKRLLLAHNGHDVSFARLSKSLGISDSECITRTWSRMRFPLSSLAECSGVFVGFSNCDPFVIKGQGHSDLVLAKHEATGAVLFASELPEWLTDGVFDQVVRIRTIEWFGQDLDYTALDTRPSKNDVSHHWKWRDWYEKYLYPEDDEGLYKGTLSDVSGEKIKDEVAWHQQHETEWNYPASAKSVSGCSDVTIVSDES